MKYKLKRPLPRAEVGTIWDVLLYGKEILMKEDNNDLQEIFPSATFSDWFEEVDERWKPEPAQHFYEITFDLDVNEDDWRDSISQRRLFNSMNCFRTKALARMASEQIKALLKEFHKNNP